VPIAISLGLTGLIVMMQSAGSNLLMILPQRMYSPAVSFPLLAVPFFILAGNLMNTGGVTSRIFEVAQLIVGRVQGGLGHVNVISGMIVAGMSGSAVADASGLGVVEIKAMVRAGYTARFSALITAASATIGPVIPPSIPFVIYASMTQVSVGTLFAAGVVPGLLMGAALMVMVSIIARRQNFPRSAARPPARQAILITLQALPALIMPIIIVASILMGYATPTEAAVIASIYALVIGLLVYRELTLRSVVSILFDSAKQSAQVLLIVATAGVFGWALTYEQAPNAIIKGLLGVTTEPWIILALVNVILLILGMFIEGIAIMVMVIPIFVPLMSAIHVDLAQFGVILTLNIMIGLLTPPVGLCLYVVSDISKVSLVELARHIWPYLIALTVVLIIVTYVPAVSLVVPHALGLR